MLVSVNGKGAETGKPGSFVVLDREWVDGDSIEFKLPTSINLTPYKGADQVAGKERYSVGYGPILLAAVGSAQIDLVVDKGKSAVSLADHLEPIPGSPLHFTVRGNPGTKFIPYYQISTEEFTCFPAIRESA